MGAMEIKFQELQWSDPDQARTFILEQTDKNITTIWNSIYKNLPS